MAFRLVVKAPVMAKVSRARLARRLQLEPGGERARSRLEARAPAAPGGSRRSMRDSRPGTPIHSCACAMSVSMSASYAATVQHARHSRP